jgi:hypothetical protein
MHYLRSATASRSITQASITFEITHCFHPARGQKLALAMRKNNWGEDRVMYYNAQGRLCSMLASWTSLALQDAFSLASAGRSWFRVDDLLNLAALLQDAREEGVGGRLRCKPNCAADVK